MTLDRSVRCALLVAVLPSLGIALVITMFAWPAARLQPRNLPVGVVGTTPTPLDRILSTGAEFTVHRYADTITARAAVADGTVYGAFAPTGAQPTVYVASAAGPMVAQQLEAMAGQAAAVGGARPRTVDVVPTSTADPHGAVLASSVLPLVFGGEIIGVLVALLVGVQAARRQVLALAAASAAAAGMAYAIAQGWLGALPHAPLATWGAIALTLLAVGSTAAGLFALLGVPGLGLAAAIMIFVGNPFSGVTSAPDLLPTPAGRLGQLLPPGAGATLLRTTAYFGGHGSAGPVGVLLAWTLAGVAAVRIGQRRRRTARPTPARRHAVLDEAG